jgi:hypothetical protein
MIDDCSIAFELFVLLNGMGAGAPALPTNYNGSAMKLQPDILFHRYFQSEKRSSMDRKHYKGKKDLETLTDPLLRLWLVKIQESLNEFLNDEQDIPDHVKHPPFHLDFIDDCCVPNAVAFLSDGYSFIGITMTLIFTMWEVCIRLCRSEAIAMVLGVEPPTEVCGPLHALLSQIQHRFIVSHEYTHHVHGHLLSESTESAFYNEVVSDDSGSIEEQAFEVEADGYAVFQVLANLVDGDWRSQAVTLLKLDKASAGVQDQALFSCFVIAIGGYLFSRRPDAVDNANIYKLGHPPQVARMDYIMRQVVKWSKASHPSLTGQITPERFQEIMHAVAAATFEVNGKNDWVTQTVFLRSESGSKYLKKLDTSVQRLIQTLGSR